jgi:hypothetical protein
MIKIGINQNKITVFCANLFHLIVIEGLQLPSQHIAARITRDMNGQVIR